MSIKISQKFLRSNKWDPLRNFSIKCLILIKNIDVWSLIKLLNVFFRYPEKIKFVLKVNQHLLVLFVYLERLKIILLLQRNLIYSIRINKKLQRIWLLIVIGIFLSFQRDLRLILSFHYTNFLVILRAF